MNQTTNGTTPSGVTVLELTTRDRRSGAIGVVRITAATAPALDLEPIRASMTMRLWVQGLEVVHSRIYGGPAETCLN